MYKLDGRRAEETFTVTQNCVKNHQQMQNFEEPSNAIIRKHRDTGTRDTNIHASLWSMDVNVMVKTTV